MNQETLNYSTPRAKALALAGMAIGAKVGLGQTVAKIIAERRTGELSSSNFLLSQTANALGRATVVLGADNDSVGSCNNFDFLEKKRDGKRKLAVSSNWFEQFTFQLELRISEIEEAYSEQQIKSAAIGHVLPELEIQAYRCLLQAAIHSSHWPDVELKSGLSVAVDSLRSTDINGHAKDKLVQEFSSLINPAYIAQLPAFEVARTSVHYKTLAMGAKFLEDFLAPNGTHYKMNLLPQGAQEVIGKLSRIFVHLEPTKYQLQRHYAYCVAHQKPKGPGYKDLHRSIYALYEAVGRGEEAPSQDNLQKMIEGVISEIAIAELIEYRRSGVLTRMILDFYWMHHQIDDIDTRNHFSEFVDDGDESMPIVVEFTKRQVLSKQIKLMLRKVSTFDLDPALGCEVAAGA
jgi:hypothetical protein